MRKAQGKANDVVTKPYRRPSLCVIMNNGCVLVLEIFPFR